VAFEGDVAASTTWDQIELVFPNGAISLDVGRLDDVVPRLRQYFSLGVRPIDEDAVSVTMPPGHETAERFRVLVTVTGGVHEGEAGSQFRVWVARKGAGWTIENKAEGRFFCRFGLDGFSRRQCSRG
jgi:hypothetical protein